MNAQALVAVGEKVVDVASMERAKCSLRRTGSMNGWGSWTRMGGKDMHRKVAESQHVRGQHMNFDDSFIFNKDRFSIGQETDSKKYYLSIPVSNGFVEYEEYYELTREEFDRFSHGVTEMRRLAEQCRLRKADDRLIMKPGSKRGSPI